MPFLETPLPLLNAEAPFELTSELGVGLLVVADGAKEIFDGDGLLVSEHVLLGCELGACNQDVCIGGQS
jgi:hypothetical protein